MRETWIVIADGAKATIYAFQGPVHPLKKLKTLEHINEPARELVSSERGRMYDKGPGGRSAMAPATDPHEHEKQVFAREIATYLEAEVAHYDRLILAAAPKMLGDIRQHLPDKVKNKIRDELDKDLTNIREQDLPEHLQPVLNIETHVSNLSASVPYAKP